MDSFYTRLELAPDASPAAIRKAYRRLVKTCHPDLHPGDAVLTRKFIEITEAYNTLSEPHLRAAYDMERLSHTASVQEDAWPSPKPFGKNKPSYKTDAGNPAHRKQEPLFTREDADDISLFILMVIRSPLTYCLIAVFLMFYGLKEMLDGMTHPHPP